MDSNKEYFAFISYQRQDEDWAKWLADQLEHYHLPKTLNGQDDIPIDLKPIFRDIDELSAGNLPRQIYQALKNSKNLIVVCSPNSAKSPWVNKEVATFIEMGKIDKIFPFIIDGIANSKNEEEECLPEALRSISDDNERLGANVKEYKDSPQRLCKDCPLPKDNHRNKKQGNISDKGANAAVVKIVAGMLELNFDTLWQRYEREKVEEERKIKEHRDKLLKTQNYYLSEKAIRVASEGDSITARILALNALPKNLLDPERPFVPEAEKSLRYATLTNNTTIRGNVTGIGKEISCVKYIPEKRLIISITGKVLCVWDLNTVQLIAQRLLDSEILNIEYCNGLLMTCHYGYVTLWDMDMLLQFNTYTETTLTSLTETSIVVDTYHKKAVASLSKKYLAISKDYCFELYEIINEPNKIHLKLSKKQYVDFHIVDLTIDDALLLVGFDNGSIKTIDIQSDVETDYSPQYSMYGVDKVIRTKSPDCYVSLCCKESGIWSWAEDDPDYYTLADDREDGFTCFCSNGEWIAAGCHDNRIRIYTTFRGKCRKTIDVGSRILCMDFADDKIVVGSENETIKVFEVQPKEWKTRIEPSYVWYPQKLNLPDNCAYHTQAQLGNIIAFGENSTGIIDIYNLEDQKIIARIKIGEDVSISNIIIKDSFLAAACSNQKIIIWDLLNGNVISTINANGHIDKMAFDGNRVLAYMEGSIESVKAWDIKTQQLIGEYVTDNCSCLQFNGDDILIGYDDLITIFDKTFTPYPGCNWYFDDSCHNAYIVDIKCQNNIIYAGYYDGKIRIWDGSIKQWNKETKQLIRVIDVANRKNCEMQFDIFDGKIAIITPDDIDRSIKVYDSSTGFLLMDSTCQVLWAYSFSYSGDYIVNGERIWRFPSLQKLINEMHERYDNYIISDEMQQHYSIIK